MPETKDITLHPGQSRAWRSTARFVQCVAGVQGGKTHFGPPWLVREIAAHPGATFLALSPTYTMLRDILVPKWLDMVQGTTAEGTFSRYEMRYNLPDGGRVLFRSADRPYRVEGIEAAAAWLDEADQMPDVIWTVIQARLSIAQGRCLFTTTPYPGGWMADTVAKLAEAGDPDYDLVQWAAVDNPYFPRAEFERVRGSMSPQLFAMRYEGQFVELMGLVFPDYLGCVAPGLPSDIPGYKVAGMDFGWEDSTAVVTGIVDRNDVLHIVRCYKEQHRTTEQHAAYMDKGVTHHCDPTGAQLIADFKQRGFVMVPSDNDLLSAVNTITDRMRTGRLVLHEEACGPMIDEFRKYVWGDNAKPRKTEDHLLHALEYLCKALALTQGWR